MRIAVISDIHGNYDACEAVLQDIDRQPVDRVFCLGDLVDYGPESERVRLLLQARGFPTVIGNHECALLDDTILECFGRVAYESTLNTRRLVSPATLEYVRTLPSYLTYEQLRFVHGAPPDSPHVYIVDLTLGELIAAWKATPEPIIFVGHTHYAGLFEFDSRQVFVKQLTEGIQQLRPDWRYIINAGSVGQPREPNKAAKYVIFDTATYQLETRFVTYDARRTAKLILQLGYPSECARRILPPEDGALLLSI